MPAASRHEHPRLRGYDYGQAGAYFVTICTHGREPLFGWITQGTPTADPVMELNAAGAVVQRCWEAIPVHYPTVVLDAFQIMPDHVHGIIVITDTDPKTSIVASPHGATFPDDALTNPPHAAIDDMVAEADGSRRAVPNGSGHAPTLRDGGNAATGLANIVGSFKAAVSKGVNELRGTPGAPVWQKGYHDRIIRDDAEHDRIARYIAENPANWSTDPENG